MWKLELLEGSSATTIFIRHQTRRGARWYNLHQITAATPHLAMVELGKWAEKEIEVHDRLVKQLTGR